jgi:hypothetical protein
MSRWLPYTAPTAIEYESMIWLFERGEQAIKLETRYDKKRKEYCVTITRPDAPPQIERYSIFSEFHTRILALEQQLETNQWRQTGRPTVIPSDWCGP